MNRHRALIIAAAALWALSCGDGTTDPPPDPPRPTTVTVSPATAELTALDATVQLRAQVLDQYGQVMAGAAVSWSSGDASVASVDASGLVTAAGNGAVTTTASSGSASGTAAVTVAQRVSMVEVSPPADTVVERDTVRFEAVATDANGHVVAAAGFTWASGDTSVAVVDASGLVTGTGAGEVEITATSSGVAGRGELVVEVPVPTAVTVAPATLEFTALGDTVRLMAEVRDQIGRVMDGEPVAWTSGDTTVAVVDSAGLVKVAGNGTATITASSGSASGSAAVTVAQEVSAVAVSPAADTLVAGDTLRLAAEATDANGHAVSEIEFSWASSDTAVAVVDGSGLVTGVGAGEVEVTATAVGITDGTELTVVAPAPTTVAVTPDTVALTALGQTAQLTAEVLDQLDRVMEGVAVSWSSAESTVATVDSAGLATAAGSGATTITGTAGEASGEAVVTVMQSAGSVVVSPAADTIELGDTLRLTAVAFDVNGHVVPGAEFTWSSSEVSVGLVDGFGLVTGVGEGTATITATAGAVSDTAEITVTNPDRAALAAFYEATGGRDWTRSDNWLTEAPLEDWHGVTVLDGRVLALYLVRNNLVGSIPPELAQLPSLVSVSLDFNRLEGTIPPELGNLSRLRHLALQALDLTGRVPPELGRLSSLRFLFLAGNDLEGPIPPELGNLSRLEVLSIYANSLSGPIPKELGELSKLTTLALQNNDLSGPIPPELANLSRLESIVLSHNDLSGPISPGLGGLGALRVLYLNNNDLSGAVPPELGTLRSLEWLQLSGNAELSGPLPLSFTALNSLKLLRADGTGLCAPSDPGFKEWLSRVPNQRVILCDVGYALPYLTQAVQSRSFPVPLVAGDTALLRVFPIARMATNERIPPVRATFYLDDAEAYVANIPGKSSAIPTGLDDGDLHLSSNAVIPGEVVRPGLEMVVEVDPEGTLDPELGVVRRIPEDGRMSIEVRDMPTLDLTLVPFLWETEPDSMVLDLTDGITPDDELFWDTRFLLPVGATDLKVHDPVWSSSNDAYDLVRETEALRVLEGAAGHYMGLLSGEVTGARGLASVPGRASFSVSEPRTMAHELGHNLSLFHAPCGARSGLDLSFPYPGGLIGSWGYDFRSGDLRPPDFTDLMGYCHSYWVSEYHFSTALRFRLADEGGADALMATAQSRSILLWGGIGRDGVPFMEPAFVVDARPVLPQSAGAYTIAARTASGDELFALSFEMPEVADGDGSSFFAFAVPVQARWASALASITLSGPGGSVTLDADSDHSVVILRNPRTAQVRGILRDLPAAAQADAAAAFAGGPGLEVLFSRGIPDAAAWRR